MATTVKGVMNFEDEDGRTITFSYGNVKENVGSAKVIAAMDAFIANGSVFKRVPVKKKSFYVVKTDKTEKAVE